MMEKLGISLLFAIAMLHTACGGGGSSTPVVTSPAATDPDPVVTVDADGNTSFDSTTLAAQLDAMALGELNQEETDGSLLMREEEKLARDVYLALYDIALVYDNLLKGSRDHLRSFYRQIESNGGTHTPTHITQSQFDDIVNSDMERG